MTRWRRPYGPDVTVLGSAGALVAAGIGGVVVVRRLLAGEPMPGPFPLPLLISVVILVFGRSLFVGLLVSDRGVRVRNFWRTHTIPWADLAAVTVAPAGFWDAKTIWILTRAGRTIRTPIRRGALVVFTALDPGKRSGLAHRAIVPYHFDELVRLLAGRVTARTAAEAAPAPNWPPIRPPFPDLD